MTLAARRSGLCAVILLHALVLVLSLRERVAVPHAAADYTELVFIQPRPLDPPNALIPPSAPPIPRAARPKLPRPAAPAMAAESPPLPDTEKTADTGWNMPADKTPAARVDVDALVRQAGKADRDSRPAGENSEYGPVPTSMQATLTKAFDAAKLAVPLKWYEAARIQLFSAPNDPRKIYQVKTAFGTYCLFYPDPRKIDGAAGGSQPRVGNCPIQF